MPKPAPARRVEPLRDRARRCRILGEQESAHVWIGDIGLVHEVEQLARHRVGGLHEADQAVDGLGELGGAARTVAHLPGDEARVDGAAAHDAGERLAQRPRARAARIGRVEHHEVRRAAEPRRGRREAADVADVGGAFEQVAARVVGRVQQQGGGGNARREAARNLGVRAFGAAVGARRGREVSGADIVTVCILADQVLDAGPVGARCSAEDAGEARLARRAARGGEWVLVGRLLARRDRARRRVDQRDLRREEIAKQPGDAPRDVEPCTAERGGRLHLDAGDAAGAEVPHGSAAHQGEPLRDLLAAGAQRRAAPQVDHQRARHLAVLLQIEADHLVGGEPAEVDGGLRRQRARIGGEQIASGRQHVAPLALRRSRRPGRDAPAVERGEERGAFAGGRGRIRGVALPLPQLCLLPLPLQGERVG